MKFASIGSGSKGNGSLVSSGSTCLMVDCGFSVRETEKRLAQLGVAVTDLNGLLVTHEHSDHISGVRNLARKFNLTVYLSHGTAQALDTTGVAVEVIDPKRSFRIGGLGIEPVAVPHDAREPCQYVFSDGKRRLGILSDLGHVTPAVTRHFQHCDLLFLECNYDEAMLANGPYPYPLKRRVGGDWGHLSNLQAKDLLATVEHQRLQHLAIGHISETNNTPGLVREMLETLSGLQATVSLADQTRGSDWITLL